MSLLQETVTLEKNLSLVLGRQVRLQSVEIMSLTASDLKKAYYRQAQELHPDKAASLGLDPEYLTGRFATLQCAYSFVLESFISGEFLSAVRPQQTSQKKYERAPRWKKNDFHSGSTAYRWKAPDWKKSQNENSRTEKDESSYQTKTASDQKNQTENASKLYHNGEIPKIRLRFAQYLYYSKRIDWSTLIKALSWQYKNRPRIGDLGMKLGYMNYDDVLLTLKTKKLDELFGEAAIRLGCLDSRNLTVILGKQRLMNLPIGQYFVENGYLDKIELATVLESMAKHNFTVLTSLRHF